MNKDLIERIEDYWNLQPCNVNHSLKEIGSEEYWNEVTERRFFVEPHIRDFATFHTWRGKRVLEIGCGIGSDAVEFAKHGAEYVGIDLSSESVALAKQRFNLFNLTGEFHVLNAANLDSLKNLGTFDLVYACGVLHHYPDLTTILYNIHSVLNRDGELRFLVYSKNSWKYTMIQKGLDQFEAQSNCPYAKAFSKEEIYQMLDEKFQVLRIRQDHCFMYNVEKYKQGIYELEPWFEAMSPEMRNAIKEYLGWHFLVKAKKI
jgi:2-polyprenyl-3-methyl-5-hydroxy-6-metoxy-1,4-benzoquinol methylase